MKIGNYSLIHSLKSTPPIFNYQLSIIHYQLQYDQLLIMAYSEFKNIKSAKIAFNLTVIEGQRFLPEEIDAIAPSPILSGYLQESLPIVATSGSEKARSEGIIYPVLLEVRRQLKHKISLFSGEEFNVDESVGLNGNCDFLLTLSPEVLEIEAPAIAVVAKKTDLKTGFGECIAEMVAIQRFNEINKSSIPVIYGIVSNGIQWQFLNLVESTIIIDLNVYSLPPVEQILGYLLWMLQPTK